MKFFARLSLAVFALTAITVYQPANAAERKSVTFAIIQTEEMSVLGQRWEQTLKYISTVPDSFHNTNPINAFRGIFGLKRAVI